MARRWLQLASVSIFLVASPLFASGPTGTITGTITDPTGAVIPKATVIVLNEGTNAIRDAETNEDGDYTLAHFAPGPLFRRRRERGVPPERHPRR